MAAGSLSWSSSWESAGRCTLFVEEDGPRRRPAATGRGVCSLERRLRHTASAELREQRGEKLQQEREAGQGRKQFQERGEGKRRYVGEEKTSQNDAKTVGKTLRALHSKNRAPKKWLGQHYMVSDAITKSTVEAADIQPGDLVLEVGTGTGALTQALVDAGAFVIGVEKDKDMVTLTRERFADCSNVQIFHDDFLKLPLASTIGAALEQRRKEASPRKDGSPLRAKVVSNLPFNITTDVVRRLLPMADMFSRVVLMLQDEAAMRLVDSSPGTSEYRRISIFVHFYSNPKYNFFVDRLSFLPPPKVNAAVVTFLVKHVHEYPKVSSPRAFFSMVNSAFEVKRKMLRNSLQPIFQPLQVVEALEAIGLPPTSRPEELTLAKFVELFNVLERSGPRAQLPQADAELGLIHDELVQSSVATTTS